jgi:hypothetical protein
MMEGVSMIVYSGDSLVIGPLYFSLENNIVLHHGSFKPITMICVEECIIYSDLIKFSFKKSLETLTTV